MSVPAESISSIVDELREFLGDRVSTSDAVREQHGHDESYHATALPDAVAFPQSTDEIARIAALPRSSRKHAGSLIETLHPLLAQI